MLKRLRPIALLGAAGKLGSGQQYWPWISLADEVGAIRFLLEHEVAGPVNVTGPAPLRNSEFMDVLGRVVHRPTVLPTPGFALKAVLGEFAEDVLTGQNAIPAALLDAGYTFGHADAEAALRWALDR
jgi:NAD dependent epimerase/dehydratase family enzyme